MDSALYIHDFKFLIIIEPIYFLLLANKKYYVVALTWSCGFSRTHLTVSTPFSSKDLQKLPTHTLKIRLDLNNWSADIGKLITLQACYWFNYSHLTEIKKGLLLVYFAYSSWSTNLYNMPTIKTDVEVHLQLKI